MSVLKREARQLLERATRDEALPSREHMQRVRSAVLRRAAVGGAAATVVSSSLWAKTAAIIGASTALQVAAYTAVGALAGAAVIQVSVRSSKPVDAVQVSVAARDERVIASGAPPAPTTALAPTPRALVPPSVPSSLVLEPSMPFPVASHREGLVAAPGQPPPTESETRSWRAKDAPRPGAHDAAVTRDVARGVPVTLADTTAAESADAAPPQVAPPPSVGHDDLQRQLEVLRAMRDDLNGKRAQEAHDLYRDHQQLFAGAALEVEARAALVAALCQQGRRDEAARESASLVQAFPLSQVARSVASGCPNAKSAEP